MVVFGWLDTAHDTALTSCCRRDNWIKNVRNFQDPSCYIPGECRPRLLGVRDSEKVSINNPVVGVCMASLDMCMMPEHALVQSPDLEPLKISGSCNLTATHSLLP